MAVDISETPLSPRRRDLMFYVVLLFVVGPLWMVPPLAWAFVIYALNSGNLWTFNWPGRFLFGLSVCEALFSLYYVYLVSTISGPPPNGPGNLVELQMAFKRVLQAGLASLPEEGFDEESLAFGRPGSPAEVIEQLDSHDPRAIDFRNSLRTWFRKVPWSSLRTEQVYGWLYWSIFNAPLPPSSTITPAHRTVLDEALELLEKRSGCIIPKGSCSDAAPLLLTLDPLCVTWRPLGWYVVVALSNWVQRNWFAQKWGVRYGKYHDLEYLIRIPDGWSHSTGHTPLVFIHGLGLGLSQYSLLLSHLMESLPSHPLLIPLQPHISQDIFHPQYLKPMGRHETVNVLAGLLRELQWVLDESASESKTVRGVTMLSHSNGSYMHGWMLKSHPEMVTRSCFVDPVTFCSWEGDVCYNFIYRPCATALELVMRYFVGTELGVANLLQRHFDWSSNSLWYEEIPHAHDPARAAFFLGGKDDIVVAERVRRYLRSHGVRKGLWFDPEGRHGEALLTGGEGLKEIVRWLRDVPADKSSKTVE